MNRRTFRRVRTHPAIPIEVHVMGDTFLDVLQASDASEGGLGILVPHRFEGCDIDKAVNLLIKIGSQRVFKAEGVIRHIVAGHDRSARFGVQFTKISDADRDRLRAYVERRLAEGAEI